MDKLIDVHSHLDHPWIAKDLDAVIERAEKAATVQAST